MTVYRGSPQVENRSKNLSRHVQNALNFLSLPLKQVRICLKNGLLQGNSKSLPGQEGAQSD